MTLATMAALLLGGSGVGEAVLLAQLTFREQIIIRLPSRQPRPEPLRWKEKGGPKCIPADALAGAQVSRDGVDLLLRGGKRVRARLGRCPPLDYYSGFYIRPGRDGRVCEDRDAIRVRSGGSCEIEEFRTLVPDRKR